jgi:amidohydrolase
MYMDNQNLRKRIDETVGDLGESLIDWRRHLHRFPELRFEELQTSRYVADLLSAVGLRPVSAAQTGLVALLEGSKSGPTVALRADMDALPISDQKDVIYKSSIPGVCHACGHDVHMTVALGVAYVLSELRDQIHGRVKFIFQPAEEVPSGEQSGAKAMIEGGVLNNPDVNAIFGMHCWPELSAGKFGIQQGCTMAAADSIAISVVGQTAHAGNPQKGRDSILAAAQIIQSLHLVSVREVSPHEAHTFSIGTIRGGQSQSIVCDKVEMTGTLRTTSRQVRDYLVGRLSDAVRDTAETIG